jgi:hypothetical protein
VGKRAKIKTSITVDPELMAYAKEQAELLGGLDLSSFIRILIAAHKKQNHPKR